MTRRTITCKRTDEYGSPGAHAIHIARRSMLKAGAWSAAVVVAGTVAFAVATMPDMALWVPAIPAAVGFAAASTARSWWRRGERAFVGAKSERMVAAAISAARPDVVIHGALLGAGGDCDHVVLGPVVAAVETKTGYGVVRVDRSGALRAGHRAIPGDPLGQARRQAEALSRRAGTHAHPIVCVSGMTGMPFHHDGVTVCPPSSVASVLAASPRVMPVDRARILAVQLAG
jgi:hypothetical protein